MGPLFFRGSVLISQQIISYNDFMQMLYRDFKRIESTYYFMMNSREKNTTRNSGQNKEVLKEKFSQLPSVHIDDLDLPDMYKDIFYD